MWERLRRFSALSGPAKKLFARAWLALLFISLHLRWRGFRETCAAVERRAAVPAGDSKKEDVTAMTVRMVNAAARHGFLRFSCLEQSLALLWLLARQGIPAELRVGVRKDGEKFAAHAWVESRGLALNEAESPHEHYAAFASELAASHAVRR